MAGQGWRIGVVGAGTMGSGIAQKIAMEGFPVVLCDLAAEPLARGMDRIRTLLDEGVERKALTPARREETLTRLQPTTDLGALADCNMVIEAVFEDLQVKQDLFRRLEAVCDRRAILATNTSSFLVADVASALEQRDRVVGLHFFFHPVKNRLVEVIAGPDSDPARVRDAWDLMAATGKTPIACKDAPGFCVNRYFVPWLNEATRILQEGTATIADIEQAAKQAFAIGMGPFELMNVTGIPIAYHAAASLGDRLGAFYLPSEALGAQFRSGNLWDLSGEPDASKAEAIGSRLLAVTWLVAGQIRDEDVATLEDTDRGAKIGLRWRFGPFELMNRKGVPAAVEGVRAYLAGSGNALPMPAVLTAQAGKGQAWPFKLVDVSLRDGIAHLTINRPEALNALDADVLAQLEEAFGAAVEDPAVKGIVLRGAGKAFVAGADIRFFVKAIEQDRLAELVTFTGKAQAFFKAIALSPKPVTAAVHGLALGGGAELALTAHRVVATTKASLGFPETGIGIYPALGGTFRTSRRVGPDLAKYALLTGKVFKAQEAFDLGLVDMLVEPLELEDTLARVAAEPFEPARRSPEAFAVIERLFAGSPPALLQEGFAPIGPEAAAILSTVRRKAPIAVRVSADLVDKNATLPDEAAYANELAGVQDIFATHDALVGLKSVGRERPVFQGN